MSAKDGGPAFPVPMVSDGDAVGDVNERGMSLLDYFAAHAPRKAHSWYSPTVPPRPEPMFSHNHPHERQCDGTYDCVPANVEELNDYDKEHRKQFAVQWPYAYAAAMLAERNKRSAQS